MRKSIRFSFVLAPLEKRVLIQLAILNGGLSQAAFLRYLIREAAKNAGIWYDQKEDEYAREIN